MQANGSKKDAAKDTREGMENYCWNIEQMHPVEKKRNDEKPKLG